MAFFNEKCRLGQATFCWGAVCHYFPEYGKHGGHFLPRSHRALQGWGDRTPARTRDPHAWCVWADTYSGIPAARALTAWASTMVARASGAAQRRKLRRLRAALRHEQQSIAMALASALHHSADKTTRAQYNAPRGQKNAGTEYYELSDEDVVSARGSRPPCLGEPRGPQERDQPRTVEQIAVYAPMVQILDAPVAQMVEQLPNLVQFLHILRPDPEQVIEVPKILPHDVPPRRWCRDTQLVEQLVEVPTIISYSSLLQRTMEQHVDIPVPGEMLVFKVLSQNRVQQRLFLLQNALLSGLWSRSLVLPGGGLQDFRPVQSSSSSSHFPAGILGDADEPGEGVFRTFPQLKKSAKLGPHSSPRVHASVSSSTPAPQHTRLTAWVMILTDQGPHYWDRRTGETRWQMEDGYRPSWWLRPDGRYERLGEW